VEGAKDQFWKISQGKGGYLITSTTYARGVEFNEKTKPFVDAYFRKYGETPTYTADTYTVLKHYLIEPIEKTGSLDPEKLIPFMEGYTYKTPNGITKFSRNAEGKPLHDITWGPGLQTGIAIQWINGRINGVWPYKWKATPEAPEYTVKGTVPIQLPPWMIAKYKKK